MVATTMTGTSRHIRSGVEEAHRGRVGPVQVLEEDDDRLRPRQQARSTGPEPRRLVPDALGFGRDPARAAAFEVEAEPGPDDVGRADGFLTLP